MDHISVVFMMLVTYCCVRNYPGVAENSKHVPHSFCGSWVWVWFSSFRVFHEVAIKMSPRLQSSEDLNVAGDLLPNSLLWLLLGGLSSSSGTLSRSTGMSSQYGAWISLEQIIKQRDQDEISFMIYHHKSYSFISATLYLSA